MKEVENKKEKLKSNETNDDEKTCKEEEIKNKDTSKQNSKVNTLEETKKEETVKSKITKDKGKEEHPNRNKILRWLYIICIVCIPIFFVYTHFRFYEFEQDFKESQNEILDIVEKNNSINIYVDEENKEDIKQELEETLKKANIETNFDLLGLMDNRYSSFQSEWSLYITVVAVLITGISIGIPIFNNSLNKEQIDSFKQSISEEIKEQNESIEKTKIQNKDLLDNYKNSVDEKVNEKLKEQAENNEIQLVYTVANSYNYDNYDQGIKLFDILLVKYVNSLQVYKLRANYNIRNKKLYEAQLDIRKTIEICQKNKSNYSNNSYAINMSNAFEQLGDIATTKADKLDYYNKALYYINSLDEEELNSVNTLKVIGYIYIKMADIEQYSKNNDKAKENNNKVLEYFIEVDKLKPFDNKTLKVIADTYQVLGDIDINENKEENYSYALNYYKKALELDKENTGYIYCIGLVYEKIGDVRKKVKNDNFIRDYNFALEYFDKLLKLDNKHTRGIYSIAVILNKIGDIQKEIKKAYHFYNEALIYCNKLIGITPQDEIITKLAIQLKEELERKLGLDDK